MQKINLEEFIEAVQKEKLNNSPVSGLIVLKNKEMSEVISELVQKIPSSVVCEISKDSKDQDILESFKNAFKNKKWLFVQLTDGTLSPLWREQLTRMRDSNAVFIQGKTFEETLFATQPEEMRLVVIVEEKNIKNINYPEFLNLFGPLLEI